MAQENPCKENPYLRDLLLPDPLTPTMNQNNWNPSDESMDTIYEEQVQIATRRDRRGRPVTTWAAVETSIQQQEQQEQSPMAARSPAPPTSGQRSFTDPTGGTYGGQTKLVNPSAQQTGGLRRRDRFWNPFSRGTNNQQSRSLQYPVNITHNTNLKDPALQRNQLGPIRQVNMAHDTKLNDPALQRNQPALVRPGSQASEPMVPRRTPHARYASLKDQKVAPMPMQVSRATARTIVTTEHRYLEPFQPNDAVIMGNGPMIPTRDGNYAATGMPRTVEGRPITSMTGQLGSASPNASITLSPAARVFTPAYPREPQFTFEQLITRVDRLQMRHEQDRELLYNYMGRSTQDRQRIEALEGRVVALEARLQEASRGVGSAPVGSIGEIGAGWYGM